MKEKLEAFELLLNKLSVICSPTSIKDFEHKPLENKWSKKEILGHLIDSAINNIQRFIEIQYSEKPYQIRPYNQNELVKWNDYQNKNNQDLYDLWLQLNNHILHIIRNQSTETLQYQIILTNGKKANLEFLIQDYFDHFYHHLHQINSEWN